MTPREIRRLQDTLECMADVVTCIDDVESVDWTACEPQQLDIQISSSGDNKGVSFVNRLPVGVLLVGMRAMQRALAAMAGLPEEVA